MNRAQIIDDAFNLARYVEAQHYMCARAQGERVTGELWSCRAGMINTTLALRTTKYLAKERDFIPWESALRNLDYFLLMLDRTEVYEALQASTASPAQASREPRWARARALTCLYFLPEGLPEETDPAPVPALQDHHSQLDQDSRWTHRPVRNISPLSPCPSRSSPTSCPPGTTRSTPLKPPVL